VFREWCRSSFNKSFPVVTLAVALPLFPLAAGAAALPVLLQEVQAQYQKMAGIEARFSQETDVKATRQVKKAKGRIWIKRPNKLRWETLEPDPNILVSDGKTFWFYTPPFDVSERGQVIIKRSAQIQTRFLNALLSGSFDFGAGAVSIEDRMRGQFVLKPKAGTAGDVTSAEIRIDPMKKTIQQVNLIHSSGNKTEIRLEELKLMTQLEEALFRFVPDKNTDKIVE
jgi:outer membrane lipoprotein carrier protein